MKKETIKHLIKNVIYNEIEALKILSALLIKPIDSMGSFKLKK